MAHDARVYDSTSNTPTANFSNQSVFHPKSPSNSEVDESPLQKSMDRNKESLKVKLMLRRPINQLVAQGIIPPDVGQVDPSLAERQRMLKKCLLVDSLNDQLSHRPGPLELIKKNILHTEEPIERAVKEGHIEFKATSEGHKLKPASPDQYMIIDDDSQSSDTQSPQDGQLLGESSIPSSPSSSSSASLISSAHLQSQCATVSMVDDTLAISSSDMLRSAVAQAGVMTVVVAAGATSPLSMGSSTSSLSPLSSVASPLSISCINNTTYSSSTPTFTTTNPTLSIPQQQPAPGKEKNRKKLKSKLQQQRMKIIKFHEYKGPTSTQKNSSSPIPNNTENPSLNSQTSYELLLQQQQLFLQWQLEFNQKYPQIMLPTADQNKASATILSLPISSPSLSSDHSVDLSLDNVTPNPVPPPPPPLPPTPPPTTLPSTKIVIASKNNKPLRNLEDMKVSDLKAELKKRNLRVSGAKTHLIQRLKPYAEHGISNSHPHHHHHHHHHPVQPNSVIPLLDNSVQDTQRSTNLSSIMLQAFETSNHKSASSGETVHTHNSNSDDTIGEDIIRDQQKKIEELQKLLLKSQLLLQNQRQQQQFQQKPQTFQSQQTINAKASLAAFLQQQQLNQALAQHQQILQKEIQQQQLQMQQVAMNMQTLAPKPGQTASDYDKNKVLLRTNINDSQHALINDDLMRDNNTIILSEQPAILEIKSDGSNLRTLSLPNFVGTFVQPQFVLSSQGTKQLVLNSESIITRENLQMLTNNKILTKISNPISLENLTTTFPANELLSRKCGPDNIQNNNNTVPENQTMDSNDLFVTLHIPEETERTENKIENQNNDEISKLFKPENVVAENVNVNDVLDLLMKNGEFDPPESSSVIPQQQELQHCQQLTLEYQQQQQIPQEKYDESRNIQDDCHVPSQHLSLQELGIEMEEFPMNLNEANIDNCHEFMDVDNDWLDRLISTELGQPINNNTSSMIINSGNKENNETVDPLGIFNVDDNDFKIATEFSWDRIDCAT